MNLTTDPGELTNGHIGTSVSKKIKSIESAPALY